MPITKTSTSWSDCPVLITGGAGFIGSTLARELSDQGANVTVVDSLVPEYGGNLFNLQGYDKRVSINLSDIRDPYSLAALLKDKAVLFNLAGQTSHLDSMLDPQTDLDINCGAQLSLLELCRKVNPSIHIVFASTRQLYGKPIYLPVDEQHPINPVDINGINKLSAELYHGLYRRVHGISATILRLTNTIGPRMRIRDARQTFLGIWIRQLLEDQPIEVWGGSQIRDFNDVDDVVDALLLAGSQRGLGPEPYNLGSRHTISLLELAEELIRLYGRGRISVRTYPENRRKIDIGDYYSCHDRFSTATGWSPHRDLTSTLSRTITYYEQHLHHYI